MKVIRTSHQAVVVLAALGLLLAAAPSTKPSGLRRAPTIGWKSSVKPKEGEEDNQINPAKLVGRIVVVVFLDSEGGDSGPLLKQIRGLAPGLMPKGVEFVGVVRGTNQAGYDSLVQEHYITWPVFFDPKNGADGILRQWKVTKTPWAAIVDPKGNLVAENVPPAELEARLMEQLELTPPRLFDDKLIAQANFEIEVAKRLLATGNWQGAIRALSRMPSELYRSEGVMENFVPISRDLEGAIPAVFAKTELLAEQKQSPKAILILEQLQRAMKGSNQEPKIEDQLNSFLDDPDVKAEWTKVKKNVEAADMIEAGEDLETLLDFVSAHGIYGQVLKNYASTPAAGKAREKIAAIEGDAGRRRKVRDAEFGERASAMLKTADAYRTSKMADKAMSFYEQIIKDYEGTTAAAEAKEKLKTLSGP